MSCVAWHGRIHLGRTGRSVSEARRDDRDSIRPDSPETPRNPPTRASVSHARSFVCTPRTPRRIDRPSSALRLGLAIDRAPQSSADMLVRRSNWDRTTPVQRPAEASPNTSGGGSSSIFRS